MMRMMEHEEDHGVAPVVHEEDHGVAPVVHEEDHGVAPVVEVTLTSGDRGLGVTTETEALG
eukprot:2280412-Rhodomonas_salina.1